jgi:hypothetical protein
MGMKNLQILAHWHLKRKLAAGVWRFLRRIRAFLLILQGYWRKILRFTTAVRAERVHR